MSSNNFFESKHVDAFFFSTESLTYMEPKMWVLVPLYLIAFNFYLHLWWWNYAYSFLFLFLYVYYIYTLYYIWYQLGVSV